MPKFLYGCADGHVFEEALDTISDMPGYTIDFTKPGFAVKHGGEPHLLFCLCETTDDGFTRCRNMAAPLALKPHERAVYAVGGLEAYLEIRRKETA